MFTIFFIFSHDFLDVLPLSSSSRYPSSIVLGASSPASFSFASTQVLFGPKQRMFALQIVYSWYLIVCLRLYVVALYFMNFGSD